MALMTNPSRAKADILQSLYLGQARHRSGNPHLQIPASQKAKVSDLARVLEETKVDVNEFINAQFHSMPESFCRRTFGTAYPPITTFFGDGALRRYRLYSMDREISASRKNADAKAVVQTAMGKATSFWSNEENRDVDRIIFAMTAGSLSMLSFACLYQCGLVSYKTTQYVIGCISDSDSVSKAYNAFVSSVRFIKAAQNG